MIRVISVIIIVSIMMVGCGKEKVTPEEYINYIRLESNGLNKKRTVGDFQFDLQYKPYKYVALLELGEGNLSKSNIEEIESEIEGMQYYNFKISSKKGSVLRLISGDDTELYNKAVQYFSFSIKQDFKILEGDDTLSCSMAHFARNYSLTPHVEIALAFPKSEANKSKIFMYNDNVFGVGNIQFEIDQNSLKNIPELKIAG